MEPVFLLFDPIVTDPATCKAEAPQWVAASETARDHGGEILIRGGRTEPVVGQWPRTLPLVIKFPDEAAAASWLASDEFAQMVAVVSRSADLRAIRIIPMDD